MPTHFSIILTLKPIDMCQSCVFVVQYHYAIEEDSEGDNDSEEFYYGGQVRKSRDGNSADCTCLRLSVQKMISVCEV